MAKKSSNLENRLYSFKDEVKICDGLGGWHWVRVPAQYMEEIQSRFTKGRYGFIPIVATIRTISWSTALMPGQGGYMIALKAKVRKEANVKLGDRVEVTFQVVLP